MKYFFYILIPLLVCIHSSYGQGKISPLKSDPNRQSNSTIHATGGFRTAAATSISTPIVRDTLKLPFFDDFTSLAPPIDTIYNDSSITPKNIIKVINYGLHGLNDGDKIIISGNNNNPLDTLGDIILNGTWFVKRINAYTFTLYKDQALSIPFNSIIRKFKRKTNPVWVKSNAHLSSNPDSLKWKNGDGVYINDRYCINPPSYNVATFDGLNANGKAYRNSNAYITGQTDTLTSLPIDLSSVQDVNDSLVFSFFWQRGGLGEMPDLVDSIFLEFKDKLGVWKYIWGTKGGGDSLFHQYLYGFKNKDSIYFYKGFQFRFISQGEMGGSYDIWNLDYILLSKSRDETVPFHHDVTVQKGPLSLLKKFTAMPFQQFFYDGNNNDLVDTLAITYHCLRISTENEIFGTDGARLINGNTNSLIENLPFYSGVTKIYGGETKERYFKITRSALTKPTNQNNLKLIYSTVRPSLSNFVEQKVNYRCNDTITGYTWLKDYYAYDDSSAEWSYAINQDGGKIAVGFPLNQPDTLVAIDIYLPHIQQDYTALPLDMIAWSHLYPESELGRTSVAINYTINNNQFRRFMLDNEIIVNDSVYVGFQQNAAFEIPIGFDLNSSPLGKGLMFYNVNAKWSAIEEVGSLMIRPVFKRGGDVTGLFHPNNKTAELDCEIYPNPTTGIINIQGDIKEAVLTDLSGKTLLEQSFPNQNAYKIVELQNLPAGFYLLRLSNDKASTVKKIILVK